MAAVVKPVPAIIVKIAWLDGDATILTILPPMLRNNRFIVKCERKVYGS
jgi:hypothetical protein